MGMDQKIFLSSEKADDMLVELIGNPTFTLSQSPYFEIGFLISIWGQNHIPLRSLSPVAPEGPKGMGQSFQRDTFCTKVHLFSP